MATKVTFAGLQPVTRRMGGRTEDELGRSLLAKTQVKNMKFRVERPPKTVRHLFCLQNCNVFLAQIVRTAGILRTAVAIIRFLAVRSELPLLIRADQPDLVNTWSPGKAPAA